MNNPGFIITLFVITIVVIAILLIRDMSRMRSRNVNFAIKIVRNTDNIAGKDYFYYINPNSRNKQPIGVAIRTTLAFDFRLEPFGAFDKLAATLGFCTPILTGDPSFDTQVYAYSTNSFFYQTLSSNAALRQTILDIFHSGVTAVYYENGQLVAEASQIGKFVVGGEDERAETLSAKLHDCIRHVASIQVDANDSTFRRAEFFDKSVKSILNATLIGGIFAAFICSTGVFYQMVSLKELMKYGVIYSSAPIIACLYILRSIMSGTPYGADAFKNFLRSGIISMMLLTYSCLYTINIWCDSAQPTQHAQLVLKKYFTTGKHGSHSYYIVVNGWGWNEASSIDIKVNNSIYDYVNTGQYFRLSSHPGFLDFEWISIP